MIEHLSIKQPSFFVRVRIGSGAADAGAVTAASVVDAGGVTAAGVTAAGFTAAGFIKRVDTADGDVADGVIAPRRQCARQQGLRHERLLVGGCHERIMHGGPRALGARDGARPRRADALDSVTSTALAEPGTSCRVLVIGPMTLPPVSKSRPANQMDRRP